MPSLTGDPADPFVLGHAPFWPVDRLVAPDAWAGHIPFAFWIVDALRPRLLVELGTHSGNSYLAFAQAVHRLGLGTACFAVDTWHGDAHAGYYGEEVFLELSRYHDARYGAFSRLVRSTFDQAAQHFSDASVDLLHVDGYHTCEAVAHDFETWRPKLSARAVVLFHDINVREGDFGVWRLWDELRSGYPHFEFLHGHGLGVLGVGSDPPAAVTTLLRTTRDAAGVGRIREAFARLGSAVVERLHFQARAEALQNEVGRLGEALRAAGQEVAARDELLRRGADERAGREAEIAEQRRLIEQLGQERAGREAEIAEQRRLIEQLQHEIVRLGTLRVADRQELTGVGERLHRVERERAEAHDEVETLRAALMALHQSRSIRLTRPLRQAGGWYRSTVAWVRRGARPP
jgi:Methyltransferase domain